MSKNIDFIRNVLLERITRPQMALALYPSTSGTTKAKVQVTNTAIVLKYSTSTDDTITYIGKTVAQVAADINRTSKPVRAVALTSATHLTSGDLVAASSGVLTIPDNFNIYDRVGDDGVVLRIARYAVSYNTLSKVKLLPPHPEPPDMPWHARLSVGDFITTYKGRDFFFSVPEYEKQTWSKKLGRPFKDVTGASVTQKKENVIQLSRFPIYWTGDNLVFYRGSSPMSADIVEDVDVYNGLVYIKPGVNIDDNTNVSYSYLEDNYIYPYLNINAHFDQNPFMLDKYVVFYLRPTNGTVSIQLNRAVFHSIGETVQEAIDSIEVDRDIPIAIIGAYNISQIVASDRATILDTRVKGGGLLDSKGLSSPKHIVDISFAVNDGTEDLAKIEDVYPDSKSYWDIGKYDGEPYPGAATILVDIPDNVKDFLPEKDIRQKATKFAAAGVYPVFRFTKRDEIYDTQTTDVSMFSGSVTPSGYYWSPNPRVIPGNSVITPWTTDTVPIHTVSGDSQYWIQTNSVTGYYQSYVKGPSDAVVSWKERTLVHFSGLSGQGKQDTFTAWESKRFIDKRPVADGQLTKGFVSLGSKYHVKQYKDLSVYAPYSNAFTGDLLSTLAEESSRVQRVNELVQTSGNVSPVAVVSRISNVSGLQVAAEDDYVGTHVRSKAALVLANTTAKTVYSGIADQIGTGIRNSLGGSGIFQTYTVTGDNYYHKTVASYELAPQITSLTDYMRYRWQNYGTGDPGYRHALSGFGNALQSLSGTNASGSQGWYPPRYSVTAASQTNVTLAALDVTLGAAGGHEVASSSEDHRTTEVVAALSSLWSSVHSLDQTFFDNLDILSGSLENVLHYEMPNWVRVGYSGTVNGTIIAFLSNLETTGSAVPDNWYARHDKHGELVGTVALDGLSIIKNIQSGHAVAGSVSSFAGSDLFALSGFRDDVKKVLDTVYTGFEQTLLKGGILDNHIPRLLEAYGTYAYEGSVGNTLFTGQEHVSYSGLYCSGLDVVLRGMLTVDGDIQERIIVDQNIGPFSGVPPTDILGALSAGVQLNSEQYLPYALAVVKTLTGNYSFSGSYPYDANLISYVGGKEADVGYALAKMYSSTEPLFSAVDIAKIYRDNIL